MDGFPDSFFVSSLEDMVTQTQTERNCGICRFRRETVRAIVLCVECKIELCEQCGNAHHTEKVNVKSRTKYDTKLQDM